MRQSVLKDEKELMTTEKAGAVKAQGRQSETNRLNRVSNSFLYAERRKF
jgi:hypothetical protein